MAEYCDINTGQCFKEGKWIFLSEVDNMLETGDLVEVPSRYTRNYPLIGGVLPIINHYGIYLEINGRPMVAHNPVGGTPEIIPLDKFEEDGKITRIIRTGLSADHIIRKVGECKNVRYNFFKNCEDFLRFVCECKTGVDLRVGWALFLISIILIIMMLRYK